MHDWASLHLYLHLWLFLLTAVTSHHNFSVGVGVCERSDFHLICFLFCLKRFPGKLACLQAFHCVTLKKKLWFDPLVESTLIFYLEQQQYLIYWKHCCSQAISIRLKTALLLLELPVKMVNCNCVVICKNKNLCFANIAYP